MATTQSYSDLTLEQKIQYAKNVSMASFGVTQPNVTGINAAKLTSLINATVADVQNIKQLLSSIQLTSGASPYTYPIAFSSLPGEVQSNLKRFIPPGYTPPATITGQEILDIEQGVIVSLQDLQKNPATIPAAGSGTITQPIPATSGSSTTSNLLKVAAVVGVGALLFNAVTSTTTTKPVTNPEPTTNPNINTDTPAQPTGFEPLQEPPNTEVDEFSGIDEQIQRQKDIEDGTSEFAGIDDQIATNENTLQEPPLLTDEEVEAELDRVSAENREQNDEATQTNVVGSTNSALNSNPAVTVTPYKQDDWRIRLSLSGSANYLYKIAEKTDILYPLIATDGVVFPYTPTINSSYRANYDPAELTHSNYKMFFYKNSSVDDISITADFTAQDTAEANYMLAVIHFFKSATKMFYGQDTTPRAGTPPPLLYLTGYGLHQFQKHPLLLTSFSYNLPNDVDYIRAGSNSQWGGISIAQMTSGSRTRLGSSGLTPGGVAKPAAFSGLASQDKVTYVPTKISLSLTLSPVVTRNDISKNFSLKDYAAGKLSAKTGGGIW